MPKLKELRERASLSQRELAEKAGLQHVTICRIENGHQKPLPRTKRALAKALKVPLSELEF